MVVSRHVDNAQYHFILLTSADHSGAADINQISWLHAIPGMNLLYLQHIDCGGVNVPERHGHDLRIDLSRTI